MILPLSGFIATNRGNRFRFRGNADQDYAAILDYKPELTYGSNCGYNLSDYSGHAGIMQRSKCADKYLGEIIAHYARPGEAIAEVACNSGNNLLPLAKQGYRMFGVDLADVRLKMLQNEAQNEQVSDRVDVAQWDVAEAGSLPWGDKLGKFKALIAIHLFPHLSAGRLKMMIQGLKRYLAKGAPLIATAVVRDVMEQRYPHEIDHWRDVPSSYRYGSVAHSRQAIGEAFAGFRLNEHFSRSFTDDEPTYPGLENVKMANEWLVYENP